MDELKTRAATVGWGPAVVFALALLVGAPAAAFEVPDGAKGEGAVDDGNPRVETRLLVDREAVQPGETFRAGVLFELDPKWHVYWKNSGDSGMATTVGWSADGAEVGDLQWPAPEVFTESSGTVTTFGYGDRLVLSAPVEVGSDAEAVELEADVDYLACKVNCIPGGSTLERTVEVGDESREAPSDVVELFDEFQSRVAQSPEQLGVGLEVAYSRTPIRPGDTVRAAVGLNFCPDGPTSCRDYEVAGDVAAYRFIPAGTSQVEWKTVDVRKHPKAKKGRVLILEGKAEPNAPDDDETFEGVVHLDRGSGRGDGKSVAVRIDAELPRGAEGADVEESASALFTTKSTLQGENGDRGDSDAKSPGRADQATASSSGDEKSGGVGFFEALLLALLGGMILNLMPCVFPVLALKVASFAELAHEDRSHVVAHGAAYTGGIVGSMLVLASVVVGLRLVGTRVGWGFQFQSPLFPAVLGGVLVLFAANLFGVFDIGVQSDSLAEATRKASGLRRSFGEGILAVVLATPCSAPLLGTAVGFALTSSPATIFAIFAVIGLGLALPFVLFALIPGWQKIMPDPGNWMNKLKHVLGFTLLGAAIWLVWIVGRTAGVDAMAQTLAFLGMVGFAGWLYGETQHGSPVARWLGVLGAAGLMVGGGFWWLRFSPAAERTPEAEAAKKGESSSGLDWQSWSPEAVEKEVESGRPVLVDFTADWCITCKVNERVVLSDQKVVDALKARDVATFKADWTDGGEKIRKRLEAHGRAGVPMYLLYDPDEPDSPRLLPEQLTVGIVMSALEDIENGSN